MEVYDMVTSFTGAWIKEDVTLRIRRREDGICHIKFPYYSKNADSTNPELISTTSLPDNMIPMIDNFCVFLIIIDGVPITRCLIITPDGFIKINGGYTIGQQIEFCSQTITYDPTVAF